MATFPSYDVVSMVLGVIKLDHEFKFESLAWVGTDLMVWNLSDPLVAICPLHLHATSAAIFVWVPFAKVVWRSKKPQVLAKLGLISYSQDKFLDIYALRLYIFWNCSLALETSHHLLLLQKLLLEGWCHAYRWTDNQILKFFEYLSIKIFFARYRSEILTSELNLIEGFH